MENSWMPLINCEINVILTWSEDCVISSTTGAIKFAITDTKFHVPVVTYQIISQGDECTTGCLLDYNYFKTNKMIAMDLSKHQALDDDPKAM